MRLSTLLTKKTILPFLEISECDNLPCLNGGKCVDLIHDLNVTEIHPDAHAYKCICPAGFTGKICKTGKKLNKVILTHPTSLYHTTPHLAMPYHAIAYHIIPHHGISYHISYHGIPYHTIPWHTISYHTMAYHIPYHNIPCHIMSYHTIPWHISYHIPCLTVTL